MPYPLSITNKIKHVIYTGGEALERRLTNRAVRLLEQLQLHVIAASQS